MAEPIRVVLADDHALVRGGMRTILEDEPDLKVVGEAHTGPQVLELLARVPTDVALLDIGLPEITGLELTRQLQRTYPGLSVVILTMHDSESYLAEALLAGASGFVLKDQSPSLIPLAIRAAVAGGGLFPKHLMTRVLEGWTAAQAAPSGIPMAPREVEILKLIAQGCSNKMISQQLNLAESTIKKYVYNLMGKLGASDRGHAAVLAMRLGLVQ